MDTKTTTKNGHPLLGHHNADTHTHRHITLASRLVPVNGLRCVCVVFILFLFFSYTKSSLEIILLSAPHEKDCTCFYFSRCATARGFYLALPGRFFLMSTLEHLHPRDQMKMREWEADDRRNAASTAYSMLHENIARLTHVNAKHYLLHIYIFIPFTIYVYCNVLLSRVLMRRIIATTAQTGLYSADER